MSNEKIDKLTRLLTDSFMEEDFDRELKRAERYSRPLTFLLVDPNISDEDFQNIGYLALKKIASIVRSVTRYLDEKVRLKNRILILLPETEKEGAKIVADKILEKIRAITFNEFPEVKLKGRVGIASFPQDGTDRQSIMSALERDLEEFKE